MGSGAATAVACALALAAAGCGAEGDVGPDPNDKRAVALVCLRDEQGLDARLAGDKSIQVEGAGGPRIEFHVSSGDAEGRQFQGEAQAAEQIGAALLFVNQGGEEMLDRIETCLEEQ